MVTSRTITTSLPPELQLCDVPVAEALTALAARLTEIAEGMALISDLDCSLLIEPNGRCALHFRACR